MLSLVYRSFPTQCLAGGSNLCHYALSYPGSVRVGAHLLGVCRLPAFADPSPLDRVQLYLSKTHRFGSYLYTFVIGNKFETLFE